jgi:2-oxo-4-hydroxy-4-carboxy-5-ureidoimidazoline decarboxylase
LNLPGEGKERVGNKSFLLLFFKKEGLPFFFPEGMLSRMTINELNEASLTVFVASLGTIYEHSPWIAERAWHRRPFHDLKALKAAMAHVVAEASAEEQLSLIKAHPDLAGRLARAGSLAPASAGEQAGLGLDRLSDAEFKQFERLNTAYRTRFGFPFIIAVKRHTRASVLEAFARRIEHGRDEELRTALAEIDAIAGFRLDSLLTDQEWI